MRRLTLRALLSSFFFSSTYHSLVNDYKEKKATETDLYLLGRLGGRFTSGLRCGFRSRFRLGRFCWRSLTGNDVRQSRSLRILDARLLDWLSRGLVDFGGLRSGRLCVSLWGRVLLGRLLGGGSGCRLSCKYRTLDPTEDRIDVPPP